MKEGTLVYIYTGVARYKSLPQTMSIPYCSSFSLYNAAVSHISELAGWLAQAKPSQTKLS